MKKIYLLGIPLLLYVWSSAQTTGQPPSSTSLLAKATYNLYSGAVMRDIPRATGMIRQSIAMGNSNAMLAMGLFYSSVKGYYNKDSVLYWYTRAADAGCVAAFRYLGTLYHDCPAGVQQDLAKSFNYYAQGAAQGDVQCIAKLGYCYYKGVGCTQSYAKAYTSLSQAAAAGNPNAMYFLALLYRNGYGLARNADSANALLARALTNKEKQAAKEIALSTPENPEEPIAPPVNKLNFNTGTYQRIMHNVNAKILPGAYQGYAIRYDWSGQHVLEVLPLSAVFSAEGTGLRGVWIEGNDTARVNATLTSDALLFDNTQYKKKDHYSLFKGGELWQFHDAKLNLLQQADSIYITGNIQLYSNTRKEPGTPLFVYLSRTSATAQPEMAINLKAVNPFHNQLPVTFTLGKATLVTLQVKNMEGQPVLTDQSGMLPSGTYQRTLQLPATLPAGSYVLQLQTRNTTNTIVIVKQ